MRCAGRAWPSQGPAPTGVAESSARRRGSPDEEGRGLRAGVYRNMKKIPRGKIARKSKEFSFLES